MNVKLNSNQKSFLKKLALISGVDIDKVKAVFNKLVVLIVLDYIEKNEIDLPHIGKLNISYEGDEITSSGKSTKVSISVDPDPFLARQIGLFIDNEKLEIFEMLEKDIEEKLINITES